jgi:type IV pilus assembly protein PilW
MSGFDPGCSRARARGLTLIELMVALVLGLVLLGGLATVFVANKQTYRQQDMLARLQENGRFALSLLERDVRRAGGGQPLTAALVGDTVIPATAANNDCNAVKALDLPKAIDGFDNAKSASELSYLNPAPEPDTDAIRLTIGIELGVNITKDAAFQAASSPGNPNVPMDVSSGCNLLYPGMVVYAISADGNSMAHFVIDKIPTCDTTTGAGQFHHGPGGAVSGATLKNCTHKLGPAGYDGGYLVGSQSIVYYIARRCNTCAPSLYRSVNLGVGEEMVEGVEDMDVRYGVGGAARVVDQGYRTATDVWSGQKAGDKVLNWDNVRSARVQLLVRTTQQKALEQANPVSFNTADFETWTGSYTDGAWRQVYSTTIGVRNRLP